MTPNPITLYKTEAGTYLGTVSLKPVVYENGILKYYGTEEVIPGPFKVITSSSNITLIPCPISYYPILDLHTPCSHQQIKDAYRKACKTSHPDHGGTDFIELTTEYKRALSEN